METRFFTGEVSSLNICRPGPWAMIRISIFIPFWQVELINVFGVFEHVFQPFRIVEIDVKRDLAGLISALGTVRSHYVSNG